MPSYEPTPRRFSIITPSASRPASRPASRRNSIQDATRPSISDDPLAALELANVLERLRHGKESPEAERGRSRHGRQGEGVAATEEDQHANTEAWIRKRRDSSASTRERIEFWELRSRSQSKGRRSRSRARDLEAHRISIVPEIPEINLALLQGRGQPQNQQRETGQLVHVDEELERTSEDIAMEERDAFNTITSNSLSEGSRDTSANQPVPEASAENALHLYHHEADWTAEQITRTPSPGQLMHHVDSARQIPLKDEDSAATELDDRSDPEHDSALGQVRGLEVTAGNSPSEEMPTITGVQPVRETSTETTQHADNHVATWVAEQTSRIPSSEREIDLLFRPHTPEPRTPVPLPTPEATPNRNAVMRDGAEDEGEQRQDAVRQVGMPEPGDAGLVIMASLMASLHAAAPFERDPTDSGAGDAQGYSVATSRPATPGNPAPALPPTPEATPKQTLKEKKADIMTTAVDSRTSPGKEASSQPDNSVSRGSRLIPTKTANSELSVEGVQEGQRLKQRAFPLAAPISEPDAETERGRGRSQEAARQGSQAAIDTNKVSYSQYSINPMPGSFRELIEGQHISDDVPKPPLPPRPSALAGERRNDTFEAQGTQTQRPPKSSLSATAAPYEPRDMPNSYPYSTSNGDTWNWVVNIPPSPQAAYAPGERGSRPNRDRSRSRQRAKNGGGKYTSRGGQRRRGHAWDPPPVIERALHAASVSMIQGVAVPIGLYRGLRDYYYPPPDGPDITKAYQIRRRLPVRIFFPSHFDLTSPTLLPTVFTIHGGAFTLGNSVDDDAWNRGFADTYSVLVIALNYSKAPWAVFPGPLLDVEALYHAVLQDESLPIDRRRTAICGFDAGANLGLGLSQLPSVKSGRGPNVPDNVHGYSPYSQPPDILPYPSPAAVISVCGILDFTTPAHIKARTRPYKRQLRGPRGWGPGLDWMVRMLPSSAWSYIPYGQDVTDPLLSPAYATRGRLPPHVFVVAAELDCLAHESWRAACNWAGRAVPDPDVLVGRRNPSRWRGALDDGMGENGQKFAWAESWNGPGAVGGSTRWLLVPDVVHGFDSVAWRNRYFLGDEEARMDADMKTIAYQREVAEWLYQVVWAA